MILSTEFRRLYDQFDKPIAAFDCGSLCAIYNPRGKPFCCDICEAVPAVYHREWEYLRANSDLWHIWRGDECARRPEDPASMLEGTPEDMTLLACLGPEQCQRPFRALSCRQFPFFPYINASDRWIGLAYEWAFEDTCWIINHLEAVSDEYRREFIATYTELFERWPEQWESYAIQSELMREEYQKRRRRIPLLLLDGCYALLSPASEHLERVPAERLPKFGPYKLKNRSTA